MKKILVLLSLNVGLFASPQSFARSNPQSGESKKMNYKIETKYIETQPALVIKDKAKIEEVGSVIAGILGKVDEYLKAKKAAPAGPPFTRTFSFENGVLEFESGFPTKDKVIGKDEFISTELPKGKVASTIHVGSPDTSQQAYEAIHAWMAKNHVKEAGAPWESYLTDPASTPPEKSKMQIVFPIR